MRSCEDILLHDLKWQQKLNYCNQKIRTEVLNHDCSTFPNIYFSKKKAQHNFCSFRFKVSIYKVFHQQPCLVNLKWVWFMTRDHYPQWSHDTIVTWSVKKVISLFSWRCSKIDGGFVTISSVSLCHSTKVTFDELLWKYLVWWNVKGCLLKIKKNRFSWVTVGRNIIVPFMWQILGY